MGSLVDALTGYGHLEKCATGDSFSSERRSYL